MNKTLSFIFLIFIACVPQGNNTSKRSGVQNLTKEQSQSERSEVSESEQSETTLSFQFSGKRGYKAVFDVGNLIDQTGTIQLFSDADCTIIASDEESVSGSSQQITSYETTIFQTYNYYIRYNSDNDQAGCIGPITINWEKGNLKLSSKSVEIKKASSQISSGYNHVCVLTSSGNVMCWGDGRYGQLGNGIIGNRGYPFNVIKKQYSDSLLSDIVQISSGEYHTCVLNSSGSLKCWGQGLHGRLGAGGDAIQTAPLDVKVRDGSLENLSNIVQISSGGEHTCALTTSGTVQCWGMGSYGQLGNGENDNSYYPINVIAQKDSTALLSNITEISSGANHTCALTSSGNVKCWGYAIYDQAYNDNRNTNYPVDIITKRDGPSLSNIIQISSGEYHTCVLTSSGNVKCWGVGYHGQLGTGENVNRIHSYPLDVIAEKDSSSLLSDIVQVSAGYHHSCALNSSGKVKCWGIGGNGELGGGLNDNTNYPVDVVTDGDNSLPLSNIIQVNSSRYRHTCALTSSGNLKCWGEGTYGQLGNGSTNNTNHPIDVREDGENDNLISIGRYDSGITCTNGSCSINIGTLSGLSLKAPNHSPHSNDTPKIRIHHLEAGDILSLHQDDSCDSTSVASGTAIADILDLTTSNLLIKNNNFYVKKNNTCLENNISYIYNSGIENAKFELITKNFQSSSNIEIRVNLLESGNSISLHKRKDCSDTAIASETSSGENLDLVIEGVSEEDIERKYLFYLKQNEFCIPSPWEISLQ